MRFSAAPEAERTKSVPAGGPLVLQCELSDPTAQVHWYKDGTKLLPQRGVDLRSDGLTRTLVVQSAEISHSGIYECLTADDTVTFKVDIKGDLHIPYLYSEFYYPNMNSSLVYPFGFQSFCVSGFLV